MRKILVVIVCLVLIFGSTLPAAADLLVQEADLNPDGTAYEVNPDQQGGLWISDYWAGEVWYVNLLITPTTYTAYSTDTNSAPDITTAIQLMPTEVEIFSGGWIAIPISSDRLRLIPATTTYSKFQIHIQIHWIIIFLCYVIDSPGRLWASDGSKAFIYSLAVRYSNGKLKCAPIHWRKMHRSAI